MLSCHHADGKCPIFDVLGVPALLGRTLTEADDARGGGPHGPVVVISDRLWQRRFGGTADVIGRTLTLDRVPFTIVGVAPAGFVGHKIADRVDVWVPWESRLAFGLSPTSVGIAMARLRDDVTLAQAAGLVATIGDHYLAAMPAGDRDRAGQHRVRPFAMNRTELLESLLPQPRLLLAGPLLMLLLACANVANLQLADVEMRQREFASRAAFGASRGALLRQVWMEGAVPAVPACALGVGLAYPCMSLLQRVLGKHRVIGVVADHAAFAGKGLHEPMAFVHLPSAVGDTPCLLVRTEGDPGALATSLRRLVRDVDPTAPILRVATLRDHLDGLHHQLRVASWLLGLCGLASLALAATGMHSLLAYRVARQRREIGLRVALGAARQTVVRMVLVRLFQGVLIGLAGGIIGSVVMSLVCRSLFAGAAALDAGAPATSVLALLGAAILASVGPSYRATRVDPATVLKES
jgi:hypothetical protein